MASRLDWRGPAFESKVQDGIASGLGEFVLRCEATAKKKLQPGRGVRTGTLRRSIHGAVPGYVWASDNTPPMPGSPERGGVEAKAAKKSGKITIEFGSGMEYAMLVHQGFGSFPGYHFLTEAVNEEAPKLEGILSRHVKAKVR